MTKYKSLESKMENAKLSTIVLADGPFALSSEMHRKSDKFKYDARQCKNKNAKCEVAQN